MHTELQIIGEDENNFTNKSLDKQNNIYLDHYPQDVNTNQIHLQFHFLFTAVLH